MFEITLPLGWDDGDGGGRGREGAGGGTVTVVSLLPTTFTISKPRLVQG